MEPNCSSLPPQNQDVAQNQKPSKPRRRIGEGRTCHQCRQTIKDIFASCKNIKKGKPCFIKICQKCLSNRYGENAGEVELQNDWKCPKCRGICNCSFCMKRKGEAPTGRLTDTARESGFSSVFEMLSNQASENSRLAKVVNDVPASRSMENESSGDLGKEASSYINHDMFHIGMGDLEACQDTHDNVGVKSYIFSDKKDTEVDGQGKDDTSADPNTSYFLISQPSCGSNTKLMSQMSTSKPREVQDQAPLPLGYQLTNIFNINFQPEDIGNVLQFLEFSKVFGKVFDVNEGDAKAIMGEMVNMKNLYEENSTLLVQLQIKLLTLIQSDSRNESQSLTNSYGNNSWLKALEDLIRKSNYVLKEFPLDWLKDGIDGYFNLELSKKLCLLNFLCDEALGTRKLRIYMEAENSRFNTEKKEAKSKLAVAEQKKKCLEQRLRDENAKAYDVVASNMAPCPVPNHEALVSQIKLETDEAHAEMLEAKAKVPKRNEHCDALRTKPKFLDDSGGMFWKLKGYSGEYSILLQDIKVQDGMARDEKWLAYGPKEMPNIDKYISSRTRRQKKNKIQF